MIYGQLGYSQSDKEEGDFRTALRKALNLLPSTFKSRPLDGDPFKGLALCGKNLTLNGQELKWEGDLFVGHDILSGIDKSTSKESCKTLHEIMKKIQKSRIDVVADGFNDDYRQICEII